MSGFGSLAARGQFMASQVGSVTSPTLTFLATLWGYRGCHRFSAAAAAAAAASVL